MIYLDNNATTPVDPRVVEAMLPLLTERYGNPSSIHRAGAAAAAAVDGARASVAALIGARESEIVFTSGGTEADNAALRGVLAARPERRHLVITTVEHHAVIDLADALEREGVAEVTRVGVDGAGRLKLEEMEGAIRGDTALVSVMLANNETGVLMPVAAVAAMARRHGAKVHTDAVQALGKVRVNVDELGVDLLSLSGHKVFAPKGVGALYVRRGTPFRAMMLGGHQERDRRGGTQNTSGIAALGRACELAAERDRGEQERVRALRDRLEREVTARWPQARVIGGEAERLGNTSCVCFAGVEAEALLLMLSEAGICASSGAACSSGSLELSHVLKAMGVSPEVGQGEVRFSFGPQNRESDVDAVLEVLPRALRKLSVLNV